MSNRKIIFAIPLLITIVLSVLFLLSVIQEWLGPSDIANRYFCEFSRDSLFKEPINTWSNIAFIAAGLTSAWLSMKGNFQSDYSAGTENVFVAGFFSSLIILLGFGSMAMHATETKFGGDLDMLSMYLIAAFTTSYAIQRFFGWGYFSFGVIFVLTVALCIWAGTFYDRIPVIDYAGDAAFAFFVSVTVFFELLNSVWRKIARESKWGIYALISFLGAFAVWNFGKNDCPFCRPDSWVQAHAVWHLLFALALFFVFCLYMSETRRRA